MEQDLPASQVNQYGFPLTVISAGIPPPSWLVGDDFIHSFQANQQRLAALSPQGKQIIARQSTHFVQNEEPELVVQAIREIVVKVRGQ